MDSTGHDGMKLLNHHFPSKIESDLTNALRKLLELLDTQVFFGVRETWVLCWRFLGHLLRRLVPFF